MDDETRGSGPSAFCIVFGQLYKILSKGTEKVESDSSDGEYSATKVYQRKKKAVFKVRNALSCYS